MSVSRSLITPTANVALEYALQERLARGAQQAGSLGEIEALALRLGLVQNTLKPRLDQPRLFVFAADHGLAVDGIGSGARRSTAQLVAGLLASQLPMPVFARLNGLELSVVDAGVADPLAPHPQLMSRKIAHGTRNVRVSVAMSLEQAHAGIRAGMELADALRGNVVACAGVGVGAQQSAALVLASLTQLPVRDFVIYGQHTDDDEIAHLMLLLQGAHGRHRELTEPVEVLAALGGFETAMMVGLMLQAGNRRQLIVVDGMAACAALLVASRIAPAIVDYCVFCRSSAHRGLDRAQGVFQARSLLELGIESVDGTGTALAFPLLRSAAALLTEVADGLPAAKSGDAPAEGSSAG